MPVEIGLNKYEFYPVNNRWVEIQAQADVCRDKRSMGVICTDIDSLYDTILPVCLEQHLELKKIKKWIFFGEMVGFKVYKRIGKDPLPFLRTILDWDNMVKWLQSQGWKVENLFSKERPPPPEWLGPPGSAPKPFSKGIELTIKQC